MTLTFLDLLIAHSYGVIEDVMVNVDRLVFLVDFMIMDIKEDTNASLILGRSFLATGKALINLELGELTLNFNNKEIVFDACEWTQHIEDKETIDKVDETHVTKGVREEKLTSARVTLALDKP